MQVIPTNSDGSVGWTSWIAISKNLETDSLLTIGDTVSDPTVMGIYDFTNDGGITGLYSYLSMVLKPSTYALMVLGCFPTIVALLHRFE
jgi:hypothetical protein